MPACPASQFLSARLRAIREVFGMTQQAMAEYLGCGYKYLQRLESGRLDARLSTLDRLSNALGITVHQLMSEELPALPESSGRKPPQSPHRPRRRTRKKPGPAN